MYVPLSLHELSSLQPPATNGSHSNGSHSSESKLTITLQRSALTPTFMSEAKSPTQSDTFSEAPESSVDDTGVNKNNSVVSDRSSAAHSSHKHSPDMGYSSKEVSPYVASVLANLPPHEVTVSDDEEAEGGSEEKEKRRAWRSEKRAALQWEVEKAETILKETMAATGNEVVDIDSSHGQR